MPSLTDYLDSECREIAAACTACGACVEICPVTPTTAVGPEDGPRVMRELRELLREDKPLDELAATWSRKCNGCGLCIPACPEGVNPRRLLMLANARESRQGTTTPELFRKMARSIRLMAAMQLVPAEFDRLLRPVRARPADVVFYLGCNPIRTPHLLFNAMAVLDALDVDYEVVGGPGACCGIIHSKWEGEWRQAGRVTDGTLDRFAGFRPKEVLSWCPSCVIHLGETFRGYRKTSFEFDHISRYLIERADELAGRFTTQVRRRVVLHAHDGMAEVGDRVAALLRAIPGLELVATVAEPGYTCGGSGADRSPELKATARAETVRRASAGDVDTLVTLYHGCHAQLAGGERDGQYEVLNWTDLLVTALGAEPHHDISKALRKQQDWQAIAEAGEVYLKANGVEVERDFLVRVLPEVFQQSEFKGGLECFGGTPAGEGERIGT
jgi:Fe-S oxidoreductase